MKFTKGKVVTTVGIVLLVGSLVGNGYLYKEHAEVEQQLNKTEKKSKEVIDNFNTELGMAYEENANLGNQISDANKEKADIQKKHDQKDEQVKELNNEVDSLKKELASLEN